MRLRRILTSVARSGSAPIRGTAGFSLIESLTAIALTGILAGVIVNRTFAPRDSGEVVALVQTIQGVAQATASYRGTVGRYPAEIEDLVTLPTQAYDLCGRQVPAHYLDQWRGPYLVRKVEEEGIPVGESVLRGTMRREPAISVGGAMGTMLIDISDVRSEIAQSIDQAFDGDDDLAAGSIRWSADEGETELGVLVFSMPVRGC